MLKTKKLFFITVLFVVALAAMSHDVLAEDYNALRSDYRQLIKSSQLQRQRSNWERLISRFDTYLAGYPQSSHVEKALFLRARTWDGLSRASGSSVDAKQAIENYQYMVKRFPHSRLADDALFFSALISDNHLKNKTSAYHYYKQIITQLPSSDMAGEAKKKIALLPVPAKKKSVVKKEQVKQHVVGEAIFLEKVRYWSGPEYTRVVFDLTAPVVAKTNDLKGENPRLYFDLLYTKVAADLPAVVTIGNGLIKQVRSSQFDKQRTRVVLDLNKTAEYKVATLENPHRLVIDVKGPPLTVGFTEEHSSISNASDDSIASILGSASDRQEVLHVPQNTHDEGIHLIVVDAGHGGKDPGAIGPHKVYEKNVVLPMAKALAKALRKELGVKVLLTRSDDKYLKLRARTEYANEVGADLFISLHANATSNGKAYGLETYFLNLSKNNQAAEVAARENGTTLQEVGHLEAILFDLMANAKINESSRLAAEVQQSLVAGLKPHYSHIKDLGVKQGPFHVLLGATMPSVLIEAGFISNSREEKRLMSAKYHQRVAAAVVKGVKKYSATIDRVAKR